ncbi:hypothetical protein DM01DRAFT_1332853 [Hesseltinella vesiculosa]|uniref:Uncharacterized protein n=1 Tax=Hesseltinella vesiculosa TaxID=101127 RepID=A0A1X2GQU7_9FUNG|nr:hypothetical protein DM01DRAFT_1332853 [Hesseltinella vesiculosa]
MSTVESVQQGARLVYDRDTLNAISTSVLSKGSPDFVNLVPGVTKMTAQERAALGLSGASSYRKIVERKKEQQEKNKTFNPFALLNEDEEEEEEEEDEE